MFKLIDGFANIFLKSIQFYCTYHPKYLFLSPFSTYITNFKFPQVWKSTISMLKQCLKVIIKIGKCIWYLAGMVWFLLSLVRWGNTLWWILYIYFVHFTWKKPNTERFWKKSYSDILSSYVTMVSFAMIKIIKNINKHILTA
jgi:hypothetical protein